MSSLNFDLWLLETFTCLLSVQSYIVQEFIQYTVFILKIIYCSYMAEYWCWLLGRSLLLQANLQWKNSIVKHTVIYVAIKSYRCIWLCIVSHVVNFATCTCAFLCVCVLQNFASCACVLSVTCVYPSPRMWAEHYTWIIVNL